jgi:hypothetical protein
VHQSAIGGPRLLGPVHDHEGRYRAEIRHHQAATGQCCIGRSQVDQHGQAIDEKGEQ